MLGQLWPDQSKSLTRTEKPLRNICKQACAHTWTHTHKYAHTHTLWQRIACQNAKETTLWALHKFTLKEFWLGNSLYGKYCHRRKYTLTHTHAHTAQTQSQSPLLIIAFVTKELEGNTAPLALIKENHILWSNSQEVSAALTLQPHPRQTMSNKLTHLN